MSYEKVLVILKPDCIERMLVDEILSIILNSGLVVKSRVLRFLQEEEILFLYREHLAEPTFHDLRKYMLSGPCMILILYGDDAVSKLRFLKGRTGSGKGIRGIYAETYIRNIIHSAETAYKTSFEIKKFFPKEDTSMNKKKVIFGLSGMTECGKSTAGVFFDQHGVKRLKIVNLLNLVRIEHKPDVQVNEFVDNSLSNNPQWLRQVFADKLLEEMSKMDISACSLESMGDPEMVTYLRRRFPGEFFSIYIAATLERRLKYQMIRKSLDDVEEAKKILTPKDNFKRDFWKMPDIQNIADYVVDNNGTLPQFEEQLRIIMRKHDLL